MGAVMKSVATVMAVVLIFSATPMAIAAPPAPAKASVVKYSDFLQVKPGKLSGRVLYTDGKTPAAGVSVRVWDVSKKKFVYSTVTGPDGSYQIPQLPDGRYQVVYGDRVCVDLRVARTAPEQKVPLDVIIPRGRSAASAVAAAGGAGAGTAGGGTVLKSLIIVGAGGATAVGVAAAAGAFSSSSHASP